MLTFLYFAVGFLLIGPIARALARDARIKRRSFAFLISVYWGSLILTTVAIGTSFNGEVVLIGATVAFVNSLGLYPLMYYIYPGLKVIQR